MKSAQHIQKEGTGVYCITKKEAGETYRAARKVKVDYVSYWSRRRGKGSK